MRTILFESKKIRLSLFPR